MANTMKYRVILLGGLLALGVACVAYLGVGGPPPESGQTSPLELFPRDRVIDVQISMDGADWDTIRLQTRSFGSALDHRRKQAPLEKPYTYVNAQVTMDGVTFPVVGIRKKGFLGSLNSIRPSLKIKLDHVDPGLQIDGLTTLTFNNNQQDVSQMSQFLGYSLFRATGVPAPRCGFAQVTVNGTNLGVYSHVESIREPLLRRTFGVAGGTLYEGTVVDFFEGWAGSFETKFGDDQAGRLKIGALIDALKERTGEVILSSQAGGRAWVPTSGVLGKRWTALDFDDAEWTPGRNGAGYETGAGFQALISADFDFGDEMFNQNPSLYLRFPFEIGNVEALRAAGRLLMKVKYDDGFVAYLNGHRVAAANAPEDLAWDSEATASHPDPAALEFELIDLSEHVGKLQRGTNVLAIQGLNINATSADLLIVVELETSAHDYERAIGELVELDAFYRFWAVEGLLGAWDGYSGNRNNYFIYLHSQTDKFHFVPWGADSLFTRFAIGRKQSGLQSVRTKGLVAHRLYQSAAARRRYAETLVDILENAWDERSLLAETRRLESMLRPHFAESTREGPLPPRDQRGRSDEQRQRVDFDGIREFIRTRRAELLAEIADGMPAWTPAPSEPPLLRDESNRRDDRKQGARDRPPKTSGETRNTIGHPHPVPRRSWLLAAANALDR